MIIIIMKARIVKAALFISICVVFSYNLQILGVGKINNKIAEINNSIFDLSINNTLYDNSPSDTGWRYVMNTKKCFRLVWNHFPRTKMNDIVYAYDDKGIQSILSNPIKSCNRYITIGKSLGRMGNQMFQIASVIGTAYLYDMIPLIPKDMLQNYINLPNTYTAQQLQNSANCSCKKTAAFYPCIGVLNSTINVTMQGLFQSWKYFNNASYIIKDIFRMKEEHTYNAKQFLENVTTKGFQHVCIHVRRGDMLRRTTKHYDLPSAKFITRAMEFYIRKYKNVDFLIVSRDKTWCKENIPNVPISPFIDPGYDMALMILSDHVVVTAGTYGWWGAWLSGGTTVYYKGFPGQNLSHRFVTPDYYPPNWIGM